MNNANYDAALQIQALASMFNSRVISVEEFRLLMDTMLAAVSRCHEGTAVDCGDYVLRVVPSAI